MNIINSGKRFWDCLRRSLFVKSFPVIPIIGKLLGYNNKKSYDVLMDQEYPKDYEKNIVLLDGTKVFLRPELPTDTDMLWAMYSTLSHESIGYLAGGFTEERIERWTTNINYDRTLTIVAVVEEKGTKRIVATASLNFFKDRPAFKHKAGFALTVHDDFQNKGLGTLLTKHMLDIAKKEGLRKVSLSVRSDNARAIHIYQKCGFEIEAKLKEEHFANGKYYDDYLMSTFL
jgi:RimJ/RimL family protein N-acetyltransferase